MLSKLKKSIAMKRRKQAGMALIETVIALGVLLAVAVGVMTLAAMSMTTTENQGHLQARTAEYAQDKMEQLLALTFCDGTTDTTVFPATPTGGTGLGDCTNKANNPPTPSTGGRVDVNAPVAGYVDYVDGNGNPVAASAGWQYIRVWQISVPAGTTGLKQISVKCQVRNGVGPQVLPPNATVVSLKSSPF
jgi:type II secretory pathway pseudopilin PulG